MPDTIKTIMHKLFLARYTELRQRLWRRLGSRDLAEDALHETWLRIEKLDTGTTVQSPGAYLFRMAINTGEEQRRHQSRLMSLDEVETLYESIDELTEPERITFGTREVADFHTVLAELPSRQREMIIAARFDGTQHTEIARRFGVSLRTVEKELKAGLLYCCERLDRRYIQRFGPGAASDKEQK